MRLIALLILAVTGLSLLTPVVVAHPLPVMEETVSFVTLNVCYEADSGTGGSLDIPCIHEHPCLPALFEAPGAQRSPDLLPHSLLTAFREEHPPRT
ncbi:MAG: hypothetical protein IT388_00900 [Nitrospirales bacterium]|nr:hypothetical protein [Nitrospirales bacterium]